MKTVNLLLQAAALTMLLILVVSGAASLIVTDLEMGSAFTRFFEPWSFASTYILALVLVVGFNLIRRKKSLSNRAKGSASQRNR